MNRERFIPGMIGICNIWLLMVFVLRSHTRTINSFSKDRHFQDCKSKHVTSSQTKSLLYLLHAFIDYVSKTK